MTGIPATVEDYPVAEVENISPPAEEIEILGDVSSNTGDEKDIKNKVEGIL